jgi:hypothetical protein
MRGPFKPYFGLSGIVADEATPGTPIAQPR